MEQVSKLKKSVAWTLLFTMLNPGMLIPSAYARDTDIYTSVQTSSQIAEPNILIILDTSDSMNLPESWKEYPGPYDSHVEYLWNDTTYMGTITLDIVSNPLPWPSTPAGNWNGQGVPASTIFADRTALKTNAVNYANATEPGDPGARTIYRNYGGGVTTAVTLSKGDASWVYWLPAGTATTDARLRAPSFNRAQLGIAATAGTRGGIVFVANNDKHTFNNCADSIISTLADPVDTTLPMGLMPSTVYAPTTVARNSGKYLNQQWQRWERFLRLAAPNTGTYGQAAADFAQTPLFAVGIGAYNKGYIQNAVGSPQPTPFGTLMGAITAKQDNVGGVTGNNQQPLRFQKSTAAPATDSYGGWTDLKADMGGYNYQSYVQTQAAAVLGNVIAAYAPASTATLDNFRKSYIGNRDRLGPAPTYDMTFGTPAYYDNLPAACNPGPNPPTPGGPTTATCLAINTTASVGCTNHQQTVTQPCGITVATSASTDASNTSRRYGGTCAATGAATCTNNMPQNAVPGVNDYYPCPAPVGAGPGGPPAACTWSSTSNVYVTTDYRNCNWKARAPVHVEGVGDYWVNGSCTGDSYGPGNALLTSNQPGNCNNTAGSSTLNGILYSNVINQVSGGGNGTTTNCANKAQVTTTCVAQLGQICNSNSCPNTTAQNNNCSGGSAATTTWFSVMTQAANDVNLVHDCRRNDADNLGRNFAAGFFAVNQYTALAGAYMSNQATSATWNLAWVASTAANKPYTAVGANKITTAPNIDMYSVNYLNWKYGPKSNTNPIGRKTRLQIAKDALTTLVDQTNGLRFGLEVFNNTKADITDTGANIAFKIQRMGTLDIADPAWGTGPNNAAIAYRPLIKNKINSVRAAARTPLTESLYEAYLYFRGEIPWSGTRNSAAFIGGGVLENTGNDNANAICAGASGVCPVGAGKYESPMLSNPNPPGVGAPVAGPAACQKNFIILITDGGPEDDGGANALIKALRSPTAGVGPDNQAYSPDTTVDTVQADTATKQFEIAGLPYGPVDLAGTAESPADNGYVFLDELAWYMSRSDMSATLQGSQPVITYTIGFAGAASPVLQNAAVVAGGVYYVADSSAALATALVQAIAAIQAWNPSASSPTVPISALNRAQNSSDVYLAFFGPTGLVNWDGTVKKFQLLSPTPVAPPAVPVPPPACYTDTGAHPMLCLAGQTPLPPASSTWTIEQTKTDIATGAQTIVVNDQAVSFWTPLVGVIPAPVGGNYPLQDGGKPGVGGTGHQLVINGTPAARTMFTHLSGSGSATLSAGVNAMKDTNAAITGAVLGNAGYTAAQISTLINWARGGNVGTDPSCNDGANDGATPCASYRAWAHGAVLHSKPVVVNYDITANPPVQSLYYVSADGVLHAVNTATGRERWAFMIEEALPQLNNLMNNLAGNQFSVADGSPVVYLEDSNKNGQIDAGERAWLYFGLRRGGRAYYALDITNKDNPIMKWKITNTQICTGTGCAGSGSYAEMGDTWSTPVPVKLRALAGVPALVFGGGYDANQDSAVPVADVMGRALFVARGDDGTLLKKFDNGNVVGGMAFSIPSDPAALDVDDDAQHLVDRIYIGDMGANLYRFDVNDSNPANWTGRKIAALGGGFTRKIFFPPVAVKQLVSWPRTAAPACPQIPAQRFDAVYVGTGDREHPLLLTNNDKMFMVKDMFTGFTSTQGAAAVAGAMRDISAGFADTDANGDGAINSLDMSCVQRNNFITDPGWSFQLSSTGEKISSSPEVIGNVLNFGTYSPTQSLNACLPPGLGQLYGINAVTGGLVDTNLDGSVSPGDARTYASAGIQGRGFVTPGGLLVLGGQVYRVTVVDGALRTIPAGALTQQRSYWQREPEL